MKILKDLIVFILAAGLTCIIHAQTNERYSAPDINKAHKDFLKRTETNLINIDFIVANALGEIRRARNEGEAEIDGVLDEDTPTTINSIIVQPGADADGVTIININEGDGAAISR